MNEKKEINNIVNLIKVNDLQNAEKFASNLINRYSNKEVGYNLLATIFIKKKKFQESIKLLLKAIKINPKFTSALINLAITYQYLNNFSLAIKYSKK